MEERLEQFPAMRLKEEDLMRKFPPGSIIRQVENGKISVPLFNAAERAIYQNQVVTDRKKQEEDKAKADNVSGLPLILKMCRRLPYPRFFPTPR